MTDVPAGPWLSQEWATPMYGSIMAGQTMSIILYGLFLGRFWSHVADAELWREHTKRYRAFLYAITALVTVYALLVATETCYWGSESSTSSKATPSPPLNLTPNRADPLLPSSSPAAAQSGGPSSRKRARRSDTIARQHNLRPRVGYAGLQSLPPLHLSRSKVDVLRHHRSHAMHLGCGSIPGSVQFNLGEYSCPAQGC